MPIVIVVHHPADPNRLWANEWDDDVLLKSITAPRRLALRLAAARERGERVLVHRCAYASMPAEICCSAQVAEVHDLDKATSFVRFEDVRREGRVPLHTPRAGENSYEAPSVSE